MSQENMVWSFEDAIIPFWSLIKAFSPSPYKIGIFIPNIYPSSSTQYPPDGSYSAKQPKTFFPRHRQNQYSVSDRSLGPMS